MSQGPGLRIGLLAALAGLVVLAAAGLLGFLELFGEEPRLAGVGYGELFAASALVLLVTLAAAGALLRRYVLDPLEEIAETSRQLAEGELDRRARPGGFAELRSVARGVNRMADRLIEERKLLADNVESLEETNRRLVEARDELIRAEKMASVGRLASGLAHEIGNPLNAIMSYADVGRRRGHEGEWLDGLEHEASRIDRIVTGLLNYARPESGEEQEMDVNSVVGSSIELLEAQGKLKGIDVRTDLADGLPPTRGNPDQLQHVLINLLLNACDAIEEVDEEDGDEGGGGPSVEVRTGVDRYEGPPAPQPKPRRDDDPAEVDYSHLRRMQRSPGSEMEHELDSGDRVIAIEVLDTGPGLDEEDSETTVFDPFFTTKEPGRGTGLGLTVSVSFVASMGGLIEASNREDARGARFRVLLPAGRPDGRPAAERPGQEMTAAGEGR